MLRMIVAEGDDVKDDDVKGEEEGDVEDDQEDDTEDADVEEQDRSQDRTARFLRAYAIERRVDMSKEPLHPIF